MTTGDEKNGGSARSVPLPRISAFVRQLTHDVRNTLNSFDLQAAYLQEIVSDAEAVDELKRMRSLVATSARQLQSLSSSFYTTQASLIPYTASVLAEDFQDRMNKLQPEQMARVDWTVRLGEETVSVDIELLFNAWQRLLQNALKFATHGARLAVHLFTESGALVLELHQPCPPPSSDPEQWGQEPFVSTRRGGYGLGLYRARMLLESQDALLSFAYDSGSNLLLTRVSLPLTPLHESAVSVSHRHH